MISKIQITELLFAETQAGAQMTMDKIAPGHTVTVTDDHKGFISGPIYNFGIGGTVKKNYE